jgi:Osteopetrosis-associated transmembrane protein 1 precursor
MNHSDPFAICTNEYTFTAYRVTMDFYQKLFTTVDTHNTSASCSDKLLNKNHMNVILKFIGYSNSLWASANCDDCYVNSSSSHQNFSNSTEKFLESYQEYNSCVQNVTSHNSNSSLVCLQCDSNYQNLNNIYEHIKKSTGNKICFDLEDKVSRKIIRRDSTS